MYVHAHVDMWRGETAHGRVCRAKPIIEVTGTFVFSRFLSTRERIAHWNGHNPRPRIHFSTLLNTSYAPADLDRAPLRIRARLNLRIKLATVFSDSKFGFGRTKLVRSRSKVLFPRVPA